MPRPDLNASLLNSGRTVLLRLLRAREISVVLVLCLLMILLYLTPQLAQIHWLASEFPGLANVRANFFSQRNVLNMLLQIGLLSIYSIGETVVIITAGIDLSLGSLMAFVGMVAGLAAVHIQHSAPGWAVPGAIILALLVALAIGAVQGTMIAKLGLPAFVVTLASLTLLRSQSLLINNQLPVTITQFGFITNLANGQIFAGKWYAIPIPFVLLIFIAIGVHLILSRTSLGRYIYSIGSNEQATRLSGVQVDRVKIFAYCLSALLGGIAGILLAGYGNQGDPQAATGYELNAVAAAVIGGANLMGGEGSVTGTVLGACLLRVLLSSINLTLQNPSVWEGTVIGAVLLVAVLAGALQKRK